MAPKASSGASGDLSLVAWDVAGSATEVAALGNAHRTPYFGPLVSSVNQTHYASFVVETSLISAKLE